MAPSDHDLPVELLQLIVRFTAPIPDLTLTVDEPHTTSTLSLKQLIRREIPPTYASNRLRIIYAGKIFTDNAALSTSLNLPTPHPRNGQDDKPVFSKAKGKEIVRDSDVKSPPPRRVYIHCSIGDTLPPALLEAEALEAKAANETLQSALDTATTGIPSSSPKDKDASSATSARPEPRGFDRLLSSGFSREEVSALRSQYLTILSHTHTPENMPTGTALRILEDRWLDSESNNSNADPMGGMGDENEGDNMDDLLWGNIIGFFWPLGALVWGFREEGVWTRRRQLAVLSGVLVNVAFGFAAAMN